MQLDNAIYRVTRYEMVVDLEGLSPDETYKTDFESGPVWQPMLVNLSFPAHDDDCQMKLQIVEVV